MLHVPFVWAWAMNDTAILLVTAQADVGLLGEEAKE
jgi:hypothetical protein